jgi:hypothetical protein
MSGLAVWLTDRRFPCGTRAAYVTGCRCAPCTVANRVYARARYRAQRVDGDWNGLVLADKARAHLLRLSRAGIGRKSVAAASDVAHSVLLEIRTGRHRRISARTERRILAVDAGARADSSIISAKQTWRLIHLLLGEGFSKAELARRMGFARPAIQFRKDHVLARTALRVAKLYRAATA